MGIRLRRYTINFSSLEFNTIRNPVKKSNPFTFIKIFCKIVIIKFLVEIVFNFLWRKHGQTYSSSGR